MKLTKEQEIIKLLFKDFLTDYNSRNMSKIIGISHPGAFKILKRLEKRGIVKGKRIGKAVIYSLNLENPVASKEIEMALTIEAQNYKRWIEEFKGLFKKDRIVMIFGSTIKNYEKARDIDIVVVMDKKDDKEVNKILNERQKILPKNLHAIKLTHQDLLKNLKNKNKTMIDIVKNAVILNEQNRYVEIIKNVTSF